MSDARPIRTLDVWARVPGYIGSFVVDVALAGAVGATALLCDADRFSSPIYAAVRELGMTTWGIGFLLGAALLALSAVGSARWSGVALLVGAALYLCLAGWFLVATIEPDSQASPWGVIFAGALGAWHIVQASQYLTTT